MSDRLPVLERGDSRGVSERASATPSRAARRPLLDAAAPSPKSVSAPVSLRDTEEWLVRAISDAPAELVAADVIAPSRRMSARERLYVYQSGYVARLVECLRDDYPAVAASLGDERFEDACSAYVARHPSRSPNLNAFGRHMAGFLRDWDGLEPDTRAFHADLADLEWALVEIIHAPVARPLDLAALQQIPPESWPGVTFRRSDAVRLLTLSHPANAFYRAFREDGVVPTRPGPAPSWTVVYRAGGTLWRMELTRAMAGVLGALLDGAPLGEALARITVDEDDAEAVAEAERSVMVWFREWVSGGLFAELVLDG
jgi:hypothetical protein